MMNAAKHATAKMHSGQPSGPSATMFGDARAESEHAGGGDNQKVADVNQSSWQVGSRLIFKSQMISPLHSHG